MKKSVALCAFISVLISLVTVGSRAEDDPVAPVSAPAEETSTGIVPTPAASLPAPGRPRGVAPGAVTSAPPASTPATARPASGAAPRPATTAPGPATTATAADGGPGAAASFASEEKWGMAGYNNNEPIYTILITSHDPRIIRCTADLKGTYIENGEKLPITDRQTMTVFPNQQVQMGNWSGMDQQSGTVYSVKCRPV